MSVGKASIKRAAKAENKETVKTSVLTPGNADELEMKFLKRNKPEDPNRPVRVTEELPDFLL